MFKDWFRDKCISDIVFYYNDSESSATLIEYFTLYDNEPRKFEIQHVRLLRRCSKYLYKICFHLSFQTKKDWRIKKTQNFEKISKC